jgi:hypothetical protein
VGGEGDQQRGERLGNLGDHGLAYVTAQAQIAVVLEFDRD